MQFRSGVLFTVLATGASLQAANISFQATYADSAGEGFNHPTYGAARRSAFEYALNQWGSYLQASYAGETIVVRAKFDPLGGTANSATLGQAGASWLRSNLGNPSFQANTWYPEPLVNHLSARDFGQGFEIEATFNADVDGSVLGATNWYYGTDGNTAGNVDFVSVAMHEVGHGLGFSSEIISINGAYATYPTIYDRFLYSGTLGQRLTQMTNAQRLAAITSDSLYWDGAGGIAGNGGTRPQMYAPAPYETGSSVSHLNEAGIYGSELMSPMYSGPDHLPSQMELGILSDMGWTMVPEPGIVAIAVGGLSVLLVRRRRVQSC